MTEEDAKDLENLLPGLFARLEAGVPLAIRKLLEKQPPAKRLEWLLEQNDQSKAGLVYLTARPINPKPMSKRRGPSKEITMENLEKRVNELHDQLTRDLSEIYLDGDPAKPIYNVFRTEKEKRQIRARYEGHIQDLRNRADQLRQQAQEMEFRALSFDPMSTLAGADQLSKAASLREFVIEDIQTLDWPELEARMRAMLSGDFVRAGQEPMAVLYARYVGKKLADLEKKGGGAMAGTGKLVLETHKKLLDAIGGAEVRQKREEAKAAREKAVRLEGAAHALERHLQTGKHPRELTADFVKKEFSNG